jgi:uncharacterized coiled-coil protein SlyX
VLVSVAGISLLDLDPELGALLSGDRLAAARRELAVRVLTIEVGEWDAARFRDTDRGHYGVLIADGVLARELVMSEIVSSELLGAGDIVRPWRLEGTPELLPSLERWNALTRVRLALLDRRLATQLATYPEIGAVIVERLATRSQRLAVLRAIGLLTPVEERLTALFWHLAERWGHVTSNGIRLPLALPHRLIGALVGARRPTISTALGELAAQSRIERLTDGTWLLHGDPPAPHATVELVRQRRRLIPEVGMVPSVPEPPRIEELRSALAAAQEAAEQYQRDFKALRAELTRLTTRTRQLRSARHEARGHVADRIRRS